MLRSAACLALLLLLPAWAGAGTVEIVSVPASGPSATAGADPWLFSALSLVSHDGRYVAFDSSAADLVPGQVDTGSRIDVFLRDRATGTTTLVSHAVSSPVAVGSGESRVRGVSADGSAVAFVSKAADLVPGQSGASSQGSLFVFERATGIIRLVSHAAGSPTAPANGEVKRFVDVSGDGRWVVYASEATDLWPGTTDPYKAHVYLFDRITGQTTLVDHSMAGPAQPCDGYSWQPRISSDGRYVVFQSQATDLVPESGQTGPFLWFGIYLYDRITGTITQVTPRGEEPKISGDGRWVSFFSVSPSLVPGQVDSWTYRDVFLWDRVTGATTLVSHSAASPLQVANAPSHWEHDPHGDDYPPAQQVLSADGRWLAYYSMATDLVSGEDDNNGSLDIFLFDRVSGTNTRVTHRNDGVNFDELPGGLALSANGSRIAFIAEDSDVVPGQIDGWHTKDLFLWDRASATTALASHEPGAPLQAAGGLQLLAPHLSADGRATVFISSSPTQVEDDLDGTDTAFAYVIPDPGTDFHTVPPCRLLDTRQTGPELTSGETRRLTAAGSCGIPFTARSVAVNATAILPSGAGRLTLQPGDVAASTSTVNFQAGDTRSNSATVGLAFDGTGTLALSPAVSGGGTVHVTVDVTGYFE